MNDFWLKDKSEAFFVIEAAIKELGRTDTPFSFGVVRDQAAGGQILFFDLPRVSPLQFIITTKDVSGRPQLIDKIKTAIVECNYRLLDRMALYH